MRVFLVCTDVQKQHGAPQQFFFPNLWYWHGHGPDWIIRITGAKRWTPLPFFPVFKSSWNQNPKGGANRIKRTGRDIFKITSDEQRRWDFNLISFSKYTGIDRLPKEKEKTVQLAIIPRLFFFWSLLKFFFSFPLSLCQREERRREGLLLTNLWPYPNWTKAP